MALVRGRLSAADGRLSSAADRARHRAEARFASVAGRLDMLSPLAVLGRGYAVCWNAARTTIIRSAESVAAGDRVKVTLHEGEIDCDVIHSHTERETGRLTP
jgi:exodeoxyribonuclease VII large subunit